MIRWTPSRAAELMERQARARLQHERELNRFIERRRRGIQPTAKYMAGPLPPSHPRFGSEIDLLVYEIKREMGKYDEQVDYPVNHPAKL